MSWQQRHYTMEIEVTDGVLYCTGKVQVQVHLHLQRNYKDVLFQEPLFSSLSCLHNRNGKSQPTSSGLASPDGLLICNALAQTHTPTHRYRYTKHFRVPRLVTRCLVITEHLRPYGQKLCLHILLCPSRLLSIGMFHHMDVCLYSVDALSTGVRAKQHNNRMENVVRNCL